MEENQVKETGLERLSRLRTEAKKLGITGQMTADEFQAAITAAKENPKTDDPLETPKPGELSVEEAKKIETRLRYEDEMREKFKRERQLTIDTASIIAESETLNIKIDLPKNPTELDLARARTKLGIKKIEVKPSPETIGIESSKRGYYVFTNREQDNAAHTVNLGGKYTIHLIPDQIHVLSEFHIKTWRRIAIVPTYERVPVPGPAVEGQMGEECRRVGGKQRFAFEYLGEAPLDAPFGLVTNVKILNELKQEQLS